MPDRRLAAALAASAASAAAARTAPSMRAALAVEDARAWRWVLHPESVDLYADRAGADPSGHAVLLRSGGALHHARIALAAEGRAARVVLLPGPDPHHLATLTAPREIAVTAEALALYEALGPFEVPGAPGPGARRDGPGACELAELADVAAVEGVRLLVLDRDQIGRLASANAVGSLGRNRIARDRTDAFAVIYGDDDAPESWLRAGAALSAVWLRASRRGLSVVPSSAVVQLPASRAVLRRLLGNLGTPYLALRVGTATTARADDTNRSNRNDDPGRAGPIRLLPELRVRRG
jgi:hypothetical protein